MTRVVLDLNVIISALISPTGSPGKVWASWTDATTFVLVMSEGMLLELAGKLSSPRISHRYGLRPDDALAVNALLWTGSAMVAVDHREVPAVTGDPEDDLVLATAHLGGAAYLVTGDRRLLALGQYEQVAIISPRDFLTILEQQDR